MKKLDEYLALQKEIFDYFGYVEDWAVLPIDDRRDFYWFQEGKSHSQRAHQFTQKYRWQRMIELIEKMREDGVLLKRLWKWAVSTEGCQLPQELYLALETRVSAQTKETSYDP